MMKRSPLKRTPFKSKKQARTKATDIPPEVKHIVHARDNGCDIWDGTPVDVSCSCCHFVRRSQGGLGIPENILTLTPENHRKFDSGTKLEREIMRKYFIAYLAFHYQGWSEEKLKYRRDT